LANRQCDIPWLTLTEALDITHIYSVADTLSDGQRLVRARQFCAPHHTIRHAGLVGGSRWPRPGEVSLAHRSVLFLNEFPKWSSQTYVR